MYTRTAPFRLVLVDPTPNLVSNLLVENHLAGRHLADRHLSYEAKKRAGTIEKNQGRKGEREKGRKGERGKDGKRGREKE